MSRHWPLAAIFFFGFCAGMALPDAKAHDDWWTFWFVLISFFVLSILIWPGSPEEKGKEER